MRLLVVSATGYTLGMVPHLLREGHSVETCTRDKATLSNVSSLLATGPYTAAIFDSYQHSPIAESLCKKGIRAIGISSWSKLLYSDTAYRFELAKAIGYNLATKTTDGTKFVAVGWFNGNSYISNFIVFNYTKTMSGDVGTDVACSGYVAHFPRGTTKLYNIIYKPLEKFLRKANHKGPFSVSCIANSDGIFVSDISASITDAYTQAIFENTSASKSDVLLSILDETSKPVKHIDQWAAGVMVSVYPYPHNSLNEPVLVDGVNSSNIKHSWFMDLNKNSNGDWSSGTLSGCLGYITARGTTIEESTRRIYRTLRNIKVDGIQYRNDVGRGMYDKYNSLRKLKVI